MDSLLAFLTSTDYIGPVKATLTTKGQITIPVEIRRKLRLQPGDVLEFDESAPFLKAAKAIQPGAWDEFRNQWKDPWPQKTLPEVLDHLRGPVELPPKPKRR